jgi:hypothetical protein
MIAVGDPCGEFVRAMIRLAQDCEVEVVPCDDVYSAVAATAGARGQRTFVVGALRELAREDSRFFRIAEANAWRCCCLVGKGPTVGSGGMLAAIKAGVSLVGDAREVGPILKEWLAGGASRRRRMGLIDLTDDDLRATEAELNALLGRGTDG